MPAQVKVSVNQGNAVACSESDCPSQVSVTLAKIEILSCLSAESNYTSIDPIKHFFAKVTKISQQIRQRSLGDKVGAAKSSAEKETSLGQRRRKHVKGDEGGSDKWAIIP